MSGCPAAVSYDRTPCPMTPHELGLPESVTAWRPVQEDMFEYCLTSEKRFTALGAPPGCGKSAFAYGLARLLGGRTVILTANLGLQNIYRNSFGSVGLASVWGRSNYSCWEGGTCEDGARMGCKDRLGCPYLGDLRVWQEAPQAVTNYAYWLAANQYGTGLTQPDTLICDEAVLASEWLSRSLDFHITERECAEARLRWSTPPGEDVAEWAALAPKVQAAAQFAYDYAKARMPSATPVNRERLAHQLKHAEGFLDRTARLSQLDDNWVVSREDGSDRGRLWRFECIWPGRYRERLFRHIPRVILMSATLRRKTLGLLGIPQQDVDFREWPRQFPAANGPVIWLPTAKVGRNMTAEEEQAWLGRNSDILRWGNDRNGIIHTVSYARAKQISEHCAGLARLYVNGAADPDSTSARDKYEEFLHAPVGSALVSPSFSTGWDFPYKTAEWQTISKIAFPDTRSKIMQVRTSLDKHYGNYLAAQDVAQGSGRIVRDYDDCGTTLLIDDNWRWFRHAASDHFPAWFKVRTEHSLPRPLPKLQ